MPVRPACTQADFARMHGWARSYVTKLKLAGRLVMAPDGGIDVEASRRRIAETAAATRRDNDPRNAAARGGRSGRPLPEVFTAVSASVNADPTGGAWPAAGPGVDADSAAAGPDAADGPGTAQARLRQAREIIQRGLRLLDLGLLRGSLVERPAAERALAAYGVAVRAGLEAAVERLAPVLAAAPDAAAVAALLGAERRLQRRRLTGAAVAAARALRGGP